MHVYTYMYIYICIHIFFTYSGMCVCRERIAVNVRNVMFFCTGVETKWMNHQIHKLIHVYISIYICNTFT